MTDSQSTSFKVQERERLVFIGTCLVSCFRPGADVEEGCHSAGAGSAFMIVFNEMFPSLKMMPHQDDDETAKKRMLAEKAFKMSSFTSSALFR